MKSLLNLKKLNFGLVIIVILFTTFNIKAEINNSLKLHTDVQYDKNIPLNNQILILTDFGPILIALNTNSAPVSTKSFTQIVRSKYYNKTTFYRMFDYYFIQAGDPGELGNGDAGIKFPNSEKNNSIIQEGSVALANSNTPVHNAGSQFFITFIRSPWLDNKYIIIGEVIYGLDVLRSFFGKYTTDNKGFMENSIPLELYVLEDYINQNPNLKHHFIATDYNQTKDNKKDEKLLDDSLEKTINILFSNSKITP